ncbi:MAG: putative membrane protein insertion efficiency factor [Bradymonadia bacterium]
MATHYHAGMRWLLMAMVRFYRRFISPLTPPSCRFYPTCSAFALEALQTHNALTGTCLTVRRICSCHPWNLGGVDPVPTPSDVSLLGGRKKSPS